MNKHNKNEAKEIIFLSHTKDDKSKVDFFADKLSKIYGKDHVFYDTWSIVPGESFIGRMNEGLTNCGFFFLFLSNKSLNSKMVTREWQSSLNKAIKGDLHFIPVLLENVDVPAIMSDITYLSFYKDGPDVVLKQMVDLINGITRTALQPLEKNLVCDIIWNNNSYELAIKATMYMEPKSSFIIVPECAIDELIIIPKCTMFESNTFTVHNDGGQEMIAYYVMVEYATVPEIPFRITIKHKEGKQFKFSVYHQISENDFERIRLNYKENS